MNNPNSRCVALSRYFFDTGNNGKYVFSSIHFVVEKEHINRLSCQIGSILPDAIISSLIFLNSKANNETTRLYGRLAGFL